MFLKNSKILAPNEYFSIRLHSPPCSILVTREIGDLLSPFQEYSVRSRIFSLACLQTCLGHGAFQIAGGGGGGGNFASVNYSKHTHVVHLLHEFYPAGFLEIFMISPRPRFPPAFAYLDFFTSTIFSLPRDIFFIKIYIFSLLYYRTFILNLSIPSLFLKKLKNSNLQWFINKQSSSNVSKRITV